MIAQKRCAAIDCITLQHRFSMFWLFLLAGFFAAFPVFYANAQAGELGEVILDIGVVNDGSVRLAIVNESAIPVVVNSRFALSGKVGDVDFLVSRNGRIFPSLGNPYPSLFKSEYLVKLMPYRLVGVVYPSSLLKSTYHMTSGCYLLQAVYKNKMKGMNIHDVRLVSNKISYCVK